MAEPKAVDWHRESPDEALSASDTANGGLSGVKAAARLAKNGPSSLVSHFYVAIGFVQEYRAAAKR